MEKYNLTAIMTRAWKIFRNKKLKAESFAEALRRAWAWAKGKELKEKLIREAKRLAGITEEAQEWYYWFTHGRRVIHEQRCVFQVEVPDFDKGPGKTKVISFFTYSQTEPIEEVA